MDSGKQTSGHHLIKEVKNMMIYCQDRKKVIRAGEEIYINKNPNGFQVINRLNSKAIVLGEYKTLDAAEETLKTIFQYIRCKKTCYAMPEGRG